MLKAQTAAEAEAAPGTCGTVMGGRGIGSLAASSLFRDCCYCIEIDICSQPAANHSRSIFPKPKLPASDLTARKPSAQAKATPEGGGGALDKEQRAPPPLLELRVLLRREEFFGFF